MLRPAVTVPTRRARAAISPDARITSQTEPCVTSIATDNSPHSSENGENRAKNEPSYVMRRSLSSENGTPSNTFPTATPKTSAGTKDPVNSAQSQALRQEGSGRLDRYLKATGRRIIAASTTNIAR